MKCQLSEPTHRAGSKQYYALALLSELPGEAPGVQLEVREHTVLYFTCVIPAKAPQRRSV